MPWHVAKSDTCPTSRPWAVIKDSDNSVVACHPSKASANEQLQALYASEGGKTMTIINKSFGAELKAQNDAEGTVEAIVATYDKDSVGDKIKPGAFGKSLDAWKASGKNIPFIWSHKHDDPDAYLGDIIDAKETSEGLWVKAQIDMSHPPAKRVYDLMKSGKVSQFSFAYEVTDGSPIEQKSDDGKSDKYFELREMKIFEAGPCLIGANQNTHLLGAKRAEFFGEETKTSDIETLIKRIETLENTIRGIIEKNDTDDSNDKRDELKAKRDDHSVSPDSVLMMIDLAEMPDKI